MASNEISLPPWASKVIFSARKGSPVQTLKRKLKQVAAMWEPLGLQLKVLPEDLEIIKTRPGTVPVKTKFESMLSHWLKCGEARTQTWGFLARAVENTDNAKLASDIRKRPDYEEDEIVMLEPGNLHTLLEPLQPHWIKLSDNLCISLTVKNSIDDPLSVETCLGNMLEKWIINYRMEELVTFEALIRAIESPLVGHCKLAHHISKDVEVLMLLKVLADDSEKESIEEQLQDYIKERQEAIDAIDGALEDLPMPPGRKDW